MDCASPRDQLRSPSIKNGFFFAGPWIGGGVTRPFTIAFGGACTTLLAIAALTFTTSPVSAAPPVWEAAYANECCTNTGPAPIIEVEEGEYRWSSFEAKNSGTGAWKPSYVFLGTAGECQGSDCVPSSGRDTPSVFYWSDGDSTDGSWLKDIRPTALAADTGPGGYGYFRYRVHAPKIPDSSTYQDFREYFEPVAEGSSLPPGTSPSWMGQGVFIGCDAGSWCGAHLIYRVYQSEAPTISVQSAPDVPQGADLPITLNVGDNVGLSTVGLNVAGHSVPTKTYPSPDAPNADLIPNTSYEVLLTPQDTPTLILPKSVVGTLDAGVGVPPKRVCRSCSRSYPFTATVSDFAPNTASTLGSVKVLADFDKDGVSDRQDVCPTLRRERKSETNGCPPPKGFVVKDAIENLVTTTVNPGNKTTQSAELQAQTVKKGVKLVVRCHGCSRAKEKTHHRRREVVMRNRLHHKALTHGTKIKLKATTKRSKNVFGKWFSWRLKKSHIGSKDSGCLAPGPNGRKVACPNSR
jgi:hypothetical protein